ncbi:spore coat protein U domain-containing protein [Phyllobacterium endophyticum]|nr:spore coat protein U domain-containing protein [Phyllobacterium endophyticum]
MRTCVIGFLFFLGVNMMPTTALAQSCTFNTTSMVFSGNTLSGAPINSTASLAVNCSAIAGAFRRILVCPNLNAGSSGSTALGRTMTGPIPIVYNLYQEPARQVVWGSWSWASAPPEFMVDIPALLGRGSATVTIYGQVLANQKTAPPGSYSSQFSGAQTQFRYRWDDGAGCSSSVGTQATTDFTVSFQNTKQCFISAYDIDFGKHGILDSTIDEDGQVTVSCSPSTPYVVALGSGGANAGPTARRMTKGSEFVTYGLYRNAARSLPWGATDGADTVSGTGAGTAQNLPIYARILPQTTPTPGVYSDTVIVTVTY